MSQYWINVVSRDHVQRGVVGGFTQANHGKPWALRRMQRGDWIVFYSPKTAYENGAPLQAFTAIGRTSDDAAYQAEMSPDFQPWRRKMEFAPGHDAPIRPLIDELDFIENKQSWGYKFHFGVIAISEADFKRIALAMGAKTGV